MNAILDNPMAAGAEYERAYAKRHEQAVAFNLAKQAVHTALFSGVDESMPNGMSLGGKRYPLSTYLGECSREAQGLLFQACHHAEQGDNVLAGAMLRRFIERVAAEYADDHEEAFA